MIHIISEISTIMVSKNASDDRLKVTVDIGKGEQIFD